jgi:hypothetical protein
VRCDVGWQARCRHQHARQFVVRIEGLYIRRTIKGLRESDDLTSISSTPGIGPLVEWVMGQTDTS